jgi:hypothetical protein
MKYKFLISALSFSVLSFAGTESESTKVENTTLVISKKQQDRMENLTVGQLFKFMDAKIPVPNEDATYQDVIELVEQTQNIVIEKTSDQIVVQSFKVNEEKEKKESTFKVKYVFKDGVLVRGPVPVDEQGNPLVFKEEGIKE